MNGSTALRYEGDCEPAMRAQILGLVEDYARLHHASHHFVPHTSRVPVSGKVYGAEELVALVDAALDFDLTAGRYNTLFQKQLAGRISVAHALTTNSGSSANLLALSSLMSPLLRGEAIVAGDEVITVAAGFPTTVNPILQCGLVPVFVDIDIPTYNIRHDMIEAAVSDRTRVIMLAHALGNPFDLAEVMRVARKYDLWVIEDCCDALGATYSGKPVGSFGDIGTLSFYPAHHITTGEGGAVLTNRPLLKRILESMRDWGRDCWCEPGMNNSCGKRFARKYEHLPEGHDHKYTYSHCGYNLKMTDMQASVGLAQTDRLDGFIAQRRANFAALTKLLTPYSDVFILPEATPKSDPSWFGFPLTIREGAGFTRRALIKSLDSKKIDTRPLFAGNVVRQPYMSGRNYRVVGSLDSSNFATDNTFWIGLFPGLGSEQLEYVRDAINAFIKGNDFSSPQ